MRNLIDQRLSVGSTNGKHNELGIPDETQMIKVSPVEIETVTPTTVVIHFKENLVSLNLVSRGYLVTINLDNARKASNKGSVN